MRATSAHAVRGGVTGLFPPPLRDAAERRQATGARDKIARTRPIGLDRGQANLNLVSVALSSGHERSLRRT
jgi:hypothetical protein